MFNGNTQIKEVTDEKKTKPQEPNSKYKEGKKHKE